MQDQIFPRVIFIGDSGVGKTSLILRGTNDNFADNTSPTVGAGVTPMSINVEGQETNFHIWDTAGQEIYRSIVPLYFKYAVCAIIVFAFDDQKSFASLNSWLDMLRSNSETEIPVVIVGNKWDIEKKQVEITEAKAWASSRGFQLFFTSAKTGEQVRNMFSFVAERFVANSIKSQVLDVNGDQANRKRKKCCR
ncbi:Ras-related protein Rab-2B [Tritrichomonas foetus]|uniref:Ras-related protein Rab-2B n=1 Tax=Tritrichomonas foetus TaxID=1144522 RepID=A0A1J4JJ87_9EUKA|nr:Ras-related protein Rab-2B [Tritrichomonas foetus]|eukprot:OHS99230.1 Ras-related protein Rab-2B [Tritrichomonas foetus]